MSARRVRVGVIGAGLMGRELAGAIGRWCTLVDHPVQPVITAVCDLDERAVAWFDRLGTVTRRTGEYRELLDADDVDVVYIAVPHHLHAELYLAAAAAGRDFLGEKPFGIDLATSQEIVTALGTSSAFVRCSSEMPFFPGAQLAYEVVRSGALGTIIEASSGLLHSSDLDPAKVINWKRRAAFCGELGAMGDLGMHAAHLPLRLGWRAERVYATLQDLVGERPDGKGGTAACDTWENATLVVTATDGAGTFPLTVETKRIAPGNMNTFLFRAVGMEGGVEFSTQYPKTVRRFRVDDAGRQVWESVEVGSQSVFPTTQGGIFESGFSDAILQMWAAYFAERAGELDGRFGCATPSEALESHRWFAAALRAHAEQGAVIP